MTGPIAIRPYAAADAAALRRLFIGLQDFERTLNDNRRPGGEIAESYCEHLFKRIEERSGAIFVAVEDERVIGFVCCWAERGQEIIVTDDGNRYGYVSDLFVEPTHRRRGIGTHLLERAERHIRALGFARLRIAALAGNAPARRAYEKLGFDPYVVLLEKRWRD